MARKNPAAARSAAGDATGLAYTVQVVGEDERHVVTSAGLVVGRSVDNPQQAPDIALRADSTASRRHARIYVEGGACLIEDLGSKNGTFVRGQRIVEPRSLSGGDRVTVSDQELVIYGGDRQPDEAPAEAEAAGADEVPGTATVEPDRITTGESDGQTKLQGLLGAGETDAVPIPAPAGYTGVPLRIGRDPGNDLVLDDPNVSRFHAVIESGPNGPGVRDLESRNGTRLGGAPVKAAPLSEGDEIGIGPFKVTFTGAEVRGRNERGAVSVQGIGIAVSPGGRQILAPTYIKIRPGELVAIIGENGAGKTTLLKALAGENQLSAGAVLINGEPVAHRQSDIGYVPQDDTIHRWLTVEEALRFGAQLRLPDLAPAEIDQAVDSAVAALGLDERPKPNEPPLRERMIGSDELPTPGKLSGGQRKRACVAMEMLARPSVVFLDEPTSPLDPLYAEELVKLLRSLARSLCSVVMVTHKTDDLEQCDKVAVMARGGYMCFYGRPEAALEFFGVRTFKDIYGALQRHEGEEWGARAGGEVPALRREQATPLAQAAAPRPPGESPWRAQTKVLIERYTLLMKRDRSNLLGLVLSVPAIAVFLLAFGSNYLSDPTQAAAHGPTFVFVLVFVVVLLGVIASFRELVKERVIFRRERAIGVDVKAYVASKFIVLGAIGGAQAVALGILVFATHPLYGGGFIPAILVLILTSWAGVSLGLAISAVVKSQEQATTFIAIPLVLNLLFAGSIIALSSIKLPAALMPARWSYAALGHVEHLNDFVDPMGQYATIFSHSAAGSMLILLLFPAALSAFVTWWLINRSG